MVALYGAIYAVALYGAIILVLGKSTIVRRGGETCSLLMGREVWSSRPRSRASS